MTNHSTTPPIPGVNRILIVKLADLGDAVLATPAINAVRKSYPAARVDLLTTPIGADVLAMCPAIDRLIAFPKSLFDRPAGLLKPANTSELVSLCWGLRRGTYDALVLLHHLTTSFGAAKFRMLARASGAGVVAGLDNGRGGFLTHRAIDYGFGARSEWEYGIEIAAAIGGVGDAESNLIIPEAALLRAKTLLKSHDVSTPFVVIHPGVGGFSSARRWPIERFVDVSRNLTSRGRVAVVVVGTRQERASALPLLKESGVIDLMGETTVASLAGVLSMCELVIGADSGICHLGAALGIATISIFGPSNHRAWRPIRTARTYTATSESSNLVLRSGIPCSPCFYVGYELGRPEGCALRTCLREVASEQVVNAAMRQLTRVNSRIVGDNNACSP
ncbi:MAG TPA: glycosyltransferase family 9 protein [Thermomicrobiaceae bacterium]|nr:glycosyltransferase family 9 protein [Thermomicrobiaceae bacterium]